MKRTHLTHRTIVPLLAGPLLAATTVSADPLVWTQDTAFLGDGLNNNGVVVVGGEVYVAGYDQTASFGARVWKKSGGTWSDMGIPAFAGGGSWLDSIAATNSANIWVSGNGRIDQWNGSGWSNYPQGSEYTDIGTSGPLDATAAFPNIIKTGDGGTSFPALPTGIPGTAAHRGVVMNSPSDIWIGGSDNGTFVGYAEHWNGSTMTTYTLPTGGIFVQDIAQDGGELYVTASSGVIHRFNGTGFDDLAQGWTLNMRGGAVHEATGDLYIAGERGIIRQYDVSAGVWNDQLYVNIGGESFQDISIEGDTIWAVGTPQIGAWTATIPEPATMSLLGLGVIFLMRRLGLS